MREYIKADIVEVEKHGRFLREEMGQLSSEIDKAGKRDTTEQKKRLARMTEEFSEA
jgi:hypothetical protein